MDALLEFLPLSTVDFLDLEERLTRLEGFGTFTPRRFNLGGDTRKPWTARPVRLACFFRAE